MIKIRNQQDLAGGLFLMGIAALAMYFASDLSMGRLVRMGPGYLPTVLCWLLGFLGLIIALRGFTIDGPALQSWAWRPLFALTAGQIVFAALLERAGLVAAIIATIAVSSMAAPNVRWVSTLLLGVVMSVLSTILFIWLLGLPLTIWPNFG